VTDYSGDCCSYFPEASLTTVRVAIGRCEQKEPLSGSTRPNHQVINMSAAVTSMMPGYQRDPLQYSMCMWQGVIQRLCPQYFTMAHDSSST